MLEPHVQAISVRLTTKQRDTESLQVAADPITNRKTADYIPHRVYERKQAVKSMCFDVERQG